MAARKRSSRSKNKPALWPKLLLAVVILVAAGAGVAWMQTRGLVHLPSPQGRRGPQEQAASSSQLDKMSHRELEREIEKLREQIRLKDEQIMDLTIKLKLSQQGTALEM